jgi:hypothetical protein
MTVDATATSITELASNSVIVTVGLNGNNNTAVT